LWLGFTGKCCNGNYRTENKLFHNFFIGNNVKGANLLK
jgi:hypothetical protein